ncbi:putative metal-dependent enzyme (double-stranded beta helix superfamily) [Amycolatopsis bartoniae]|uniref:Cysteine dioxygenase n=1 Tax=Amycolatopsis bartoniae TaxID=941986 RepID=A0A8H9IUW8_9PSEU|nr:cysteine dioxygenase family protein [Amycolatopsis bartoniae]MBB2936024.1 putative metal-dependent enzyme (double-stranded beta helix superfamily) [Amycolatopsis bartoniae]TVT00894.1 cupin domain-containing protein [Amycolatopsis bartoniae]GHF63590.1 cysteine dioxygenase [Amycolatopsis bartoniae]
MFAVPDNTVALDEKSSLRHPVRVALEYAAERDRWRDLLRYDPDQRFSTRIAADEREEVWLMGWLPGQHTDLHDHASSTGAFTVVSGQLSELVARRAPDGRAVTELHHLSAGQSRVFAPGYVHQVRNEGPDPAISIHVYRAGGRAMRPYHLDPVTGPVRD